jgi:hypothetical protein
MMNPKAGQRVTLRRTGYAHLNGQPGIIISAEEHGTEHHARVLAHVKLDSGRSFVANARFNLEVE